LQKKKKSLAIHLRLDQHEWSILDEIVQAAPGWSKSEAIRFCIRTVKELARLKNKPISFFLPKPEEVLAKRLAS